MEKINVIKCPTCGAEYLPAEIYYPNHFFGRPRDIERDSNFKIDTFFGKSLDQVEHFTCIYCSTTFKVNATIKFYTTVENTRDNYKMYLKDNILNLKED